MSRSGFSLVELMVVIALLGIAAAQVVPHYAVAVEGTRVDRCSSVLRSIWLAQRMYWMENERYADSLEELVSWKLAEASLPALNEPFRYSIERANAAAFTARAQRRGSRSWSGTIRIDESGALSGWVKNRKDRRVAPAQE